mmetsp:Transcript_9394/g.22926  ORF Transcript_9394/g.22926 Transcript_9394/m.22926 type:complete len:360 (-) Transcript_9394:109-1188(-)
MCPSQCKPSFGTIGLLTTSFLAVIFLSCACGVEVSMAKICGVKEFKAIKLKGEESFIVQPPCLSIRNNENQNKSLEALIKSSKVIFLTMPSKASGSSLKQFTRQCMEQKFSQPNLSLKQQYYVAVDNIISVDKPEKKMEFLTKTFDLPPIIASHIYSDVPFMSLMQHATRSALIIQFHREETDRLRSAIRHVLSKRACVPGQKIDKDTIINATCCILNESVVLNLIKSKFTEIGVGSIPRIFSCRTFQAIKDNEPNMILVQYRQSGEVQKLLAKYHCPGLVNPIKKNEAASGVWIRLQHDEVTVDLEDWLDRKMEHIEWSLQLKREAGCQATTRHMEDDLFSCTEQVLEVSPQLVETWQ